MNGYDVGFAIGLILALGMTFGHKRAWVWLGVWAASYVASTIYHRMGWPSPIVAGSALDIACAYAIYIYGKTRWEMVVGRLFQAMLGINIIFYAATIQADAWGLTVTPASQAHNAYALMLDLLNIAVLIWIGINGEKEELDNCHSQPPPSRRGLRGAIQAFQRQRAHPPFWRH